MSANEKKRQDTPSGERVLLNPEEWEEPKGRKVLGEFHKESPRRTGVDADLERFEEHWRKKGCVNIQSEYHKPGAPYVEEADRRDTGGKSVDPGEDAPDGGFQAEGDPRAQETPEPRSDRPINFASIEIISYALFRAIFGNGVRIPLKKEGVIDADVTVHGKDIIINTNQFYANLPDLKVWQITYAHQGKPILQFGRDVPRGMKIHRWNAIALGFSLWRQTKAAERAKRRAAKEAALQPKDEEGTPSKR